jgi:hypothetical protein
MASHVFSGVPVVLSRNNHERGWEKQGKNKEVGGQHKEGGKREV